MTLLYCNLDDKITVNEVVTPDELGGQRQTVVKFVDIQSTRVLLQQ